MLNIICPCSRIGSDEDDEGEDEVHSADDVSETAVSRDIHNEVVANNTNHQENQEEEEEDEEIEEDIQAETEDDQSAVDSEAAVVEPTAVGPANGEVSGDSDSSGDSPSGDQKVNGDVAVSTGGAGDGVVMNGEVGRFLQIYNVYLYGVPPSVSWPVVGGSASSSVSSSNQG